MGWAYSAERWGASDAQKEAAVANRKALEEEHLTRLATAMRPHMEGFKLEFHESPYGSYLCVTLPKLTWEEAKVSFRYKDRGFDGKVQAEGLHLKCGGIYGEIEAIGRSYGYDFEAGAMKPAALKKMCVAITNQLQRLLDHEVSKARRSRSSKSNANKVAELIRAEGFKVKLSEYGDDTEMTVDGVVSLNVSSSGLVYSRGRNEAVPVRASESNIVEVVRAIAELRRVISEGRHG